ncbi:MAG TPA: tetratricopeptide repeat protein [Gemmataceae bacterium]|nr:tetratricopeptide repeat protein [Gemmataceae bacterium]
MQAALPKLKSWTSLTSVVLVLVVVGFVVVRQWQGTTAPALPELNLVGADPAVKSAIAYAEGAVRRAPDSADAWGRLGMVLAAHGLYPESLGCFARAERLDPEELRWPYFQGVGLSLGDPYAALPHLRQAVALCPPTADAPRLRLAEALLAQGQRREAHEMFLLVLTRDPDNPRAHLGLGQLLCQENDSANSLKHLERAAASVLTQQRARMMMSEIRRSQGDAAAAEREQRLAAALPADPEAPDPFLEEMARLRVGKQAQLARASSLLEQDRVAEAVAILQQLVRQYPDLASAWLGLGRGLIQQKRYGAAEQALRRAARLDPARAQVQFYLGVALSQQGRVRDATAFFKRATELRPDDALAQYNLGQCLNAQGAHNDAIAALEAAVHYKPHYAQAHASLGELLAEDGKRQMAVQHLRLAAELNPADARTQQLLKNLQK